MINDNYDNTETTTAVVSPDVPSVGSSSDFNVQLTFDGINIDGTIQGGDLSELVQAVEEVQNQLTATNETLMNISFGVLLSVALFGITIGLAFVRLVKRR